MKAVIDGMEVEGSPAEIAELHKALRGPAVDGVVGYSISTVSNHDKSPMTEAFAMRVLQRKPLSDAQRKILSKLASKHPNWTSFEELQDATGYTSAQLSGALGAFARRVSLTPDYADGMVFLSWDWDSNASSYNYYLTDASVAAVKRVGL